VFDAENDGVGDLQPAVSQTKSHVCGVGGVGERYIERAFWQASHKLHGIGPMYYGPQSRSQRLEVGFQHSDALVTAIYEFGQRRATR
jgi:hypothetical protein